MQYTHNKRFKGQFVARWLKSLSTRQWESGVMVNRLYTGWPSVLFSGFFYPVRACVSNRETVLVVIICVMMNSGLQDQWLDRFWWCLSLSLARCCTGQSNTFSIGKYSLFVRKEIARSSKTWDFFCCWPSFVRVLSKRKALPLSSQSIPSSYLISLLFNPSFYGCLHPFYGRT